MQDDRQRRGDPLMVQSVAKAFRVLAAFDKGHGALTLSQIAQRAGMDVSAAQRFTHTLAQLGYLRKDAATKQFELSTKVLDLAYHYVRGSRLVDRASPVLRQLSIETEEAVSLTVLDGAEVVFVSRYLSRRMLNTDVIVGTRLPAYCTAPGRAILSRLPQEEVRAVLAASDLRAHTAATPTAPEAITALIAEAARDGHAAAFDEFYLGDASLAAPIIGPDGRAMGAISLSVPLARMDRAQFIDSYRQLVMAAARGISF